MLRSLAAVLLLLSSATVPLLRAQAAPLPLTPIALAAPDVPLLSEGTVSLETTATSVVPTGTLDFTAKVRVGKPVDFLQARLQVFRPNGALIYQKTQTAASDTSGTALFRWERGIADLGMKPDAYPMVLSVEARRGTEQAKTRLERQFLVHNPEHGRVLVSFVARIEAMPMADPSGRFVTDPAVDDQPRSDAEELAAAVLRDPKVRLTVAIPPVLLQEWRIISDGYETSTSAGVTRVPAQSAVPQAYRHTLQILKSALDTGRLELLGQGYSDPSLPALARARLLSDIAPQYDVGLSAVFAALETTTSPGTAPAGFAIPPTAAGRLVEDGITYVVMAPAGAQSSTRPPSGASRVLGHQLVALLSDPQATEALQSRESTRVISRVFERQVGYQPERPIVIAAELGPGQAGSATVLATYASQLAHTQFAKLVIGQSAATRPSRPAVQLVPQRYEDKSPEGFWASVASARAWSRALSTSLRKGDPDADAATSDSLIAESSSWAGADGMWSAAPQALQFASEASKISQQILSKVSVRIENVTLSGARGDVPVSIRNDSGKTLTVTLDARGAGLQVIGGPTRRVTLKPAENFVQLPVDLKTSLQGALTVRVLAGPQELVKRTVIVRASYLDRLAIIGAIVLVLFVLLGFIVRRVRSADAETSDAERDDQRYTDTADGPTSEDESD